MRWLSLGVMCLLACGALFKTKRPKPPDVWAIKAATLHSMMTPAPAFASDTPDCKAAPMPDLEFFCQHKCDSIGELSLKAYCAWDCEEVKNPDLGYLCTLERNREKKQPQPTQCDAINDASLREHCKRWIAATAPKPKPKT
jgi:hypothetical protein